MKHEKLAQPGRIGSLELKNRIVVPALNNNFTHAAFMTDESVEFYVSMARGGASLVIIEATSIDYPIARSVLNPSIDDEKYIPGFKAIADGCHKYGCKVMVQISHVGRQSSRSVTGMDPVAPSPIASNSALYPDTPRILEKKDIEDIVEKFGKAALIAKKAGLDGVEVMMGHGYLFNNFLSPISNQRTDEYGGLNGGLKVALDVIARIKEKCGKDYPIICRINADDFIKENGNTIVDAQLIAQVLEKAGVNGFDVSGGMRDSDLFFNDHTSGQPKGAWIHYAERIKRVVSVPVLAVKRIDADLAEETLKSGAADFICFGKQAICDPDFANKILEERTEDIRPCTSCCQGCFDELFMKKGITCTLNPSIGKKVSYLKEREGKKRILKKVLVVGAGPAGIETALELAKMGHNVTIVDKNNFLGGGYYYCTYTALKKEVSDAMAYFRRALEKARVDIRLNTPYNVALLDEIVPDAVVDATGTEFVKTVDGPDVITPKEALDGSRDVGDYVAVIACSKGCDWTCSKVSNPIPDDIIGLKTSETFACTAGHAAATVAEELADRGKKVCILTERPTFVQGMGFTNRDNMLKRFFFKNISVSNDTSVIEAVDGGLLCEKNGKRFKVSADTVVCSTSVKPVNTIEDSLFNRGIAYYKVGNSRKTGNALKSFQDGYALADLI